MREIKPVELRKKEILETAVLVFKQKGYDRTSISDIAKSLGISQGLCYRYFKSKEEIFDCAIDTYAQFIADKMIEVLDDTQMTLYDKISHLSDFTNIEKESDYYEVFHGQGKSSFHDRLSLQICRKTVPKVQILLKKEVEAGKIKFHDSDTLASFLIFGQLGILLDPTMKSEEKNEKIIQFLSHVLKDITC